ncbi:MAG: selenoneine synthase SenA [bacterium]
MSRFLIDSMEDARARTLSLINGLDDAQLIGPKLSIVNPLLWEIGHTAYFYEFWVLRHHLGKSRLRDDVDNLYDSIHIAHDDRWNLPLPCLSDTLGYMREVHDQVLQHLNEYPQDAVRDYLLEYAIYHEDMHTEAFTYTRQTLNYQTPDIGEVPRHLMQGRLDGDASIPGGTFMLGASRQDGFVFDNEKWAHSHQVEPFAISRAAVSNAEYAAFVDAGGYNEPRYWDAEGQAWLKTADRQCPRYWRRGEQGWEMRRFDNWEPLPLDAAVIHVNWHEAQAYCRWAQRRLPTELEWEVAAAGQPDDSGGLSSVKRFYPWGKATPAAELANLEGNALGTIAVGALPAGDSAFGCRQMIGNCWEWTADTFGPYPGFVPDMYADYSQPLFGQTKVLRGGAWATRGRMIRNTWRTYYGPERDDVFAGFRTCAL